MIEAFLKNHGWYQLWTLFLMGLARIVPAIALTPFFGGKMIADGAKIGFGIAITFLFFPLLIQHAPDVSSTIVYMGYLVKEAFIGAILGFFTGLPFYAAQSAGVLIDNQKGTSSLQVQDPLIQSSSSSMGQFYNNISIVAFFLVGGPLYFFEAIAASYHTCPIDAFIPTVLSTQHPVWYMMLHFLTDITKIALQLSAPCLIALLMTDLFLGIINRMAPQVQITFLLWSLKAFVGILLLWVSWWLILETIDKQVVLWFKAVLNMVQYAPKI